MRETAGLLNRISIILRQSTKGMFSHAIKTHENIPITCHKTYENIPQVDCHLRFQRKNMPWGYCSEGNSCDYFTGTKMKNGPYLVSAHGFGIVTILRVQSVQTKVSKPITCTCLQ